MSIQEKKKLEEFLVNSPPGKIEEVICSTYQSYSYHKLVLPDIELYCDDEKCKGKRFYSSNKEISLELEKEETVYIRYVCKNCSSSFKIYSLLIYLATPNSCNIFKFGELPIFGPPLPSRLFSFIGPDKELFLLGRRAENQGMGIGAFAYYRRVIENQKNRIIDEIIKALKKNNTYAELIKELEEIKNDTQFSNSVKPIKSAFPESLLIGGYNPLVLLHNALSEGMHSKTDKDCLEMANSIRLILSELGEKLSFILKEQSELDEAVKKLVKKK